MYRSLLINVLITFSLLLVNCKQEDAKIVDIKTFKIPEKIKPKVPKQIFREILDSVVSPTASIALTQFPRVTYDSTFVDSFAKSSHTKNDIKTAWLFGACLTHFPYTLLAKNKQDALKCLNLMEIQIQVTDFDKKYNLYHNRIWSN